MPNYQMRYKWFSDDKRWTYSITKYSAKDFRAWWKKFKRIHGAPQVYEPRQQSDFYKPWKPSKVKLE